MSIDLLAVAISGLIVGVVGYVIARLTTKNEWLAPAAVGFLWVFLYLFAERSVAPQVRAWYAMRGIEAELERDVAFAAMKNHFSAERELILKRLKDRLLLWDGMTSQDVFARTDIRNEVLTLATQKLPAADDAAALAFVFVMTKELTEIAGAAPDGCAYYVYGSLIHGPFSPREHLSPEVLQEEGQVLADVLRTAATSPMPPPADSEGSRELEAAGEGLRRKFTEHIRPKQGDWILPDGESVHVCEGAIAALQEILSLPKGDGARLAKYLHSKSSSLVPLD